MKLQAQAKPGAILRTRCRHCGKDIKPSYERAFCPGGECRKAFEAARRGPSMVTRVVPIKHQVSDPLTLSLLPTLSIVVPIKKPGVA